MMIGSKLKRAVGANPFVGPRPFETGRKIFGRDREIDDLYYLLSAERIVLLHSPSGAGKSSLVQAGLIPRLNERFDVWGATRVNLHPLAAQESGQTVAINRYVRSAVLGFEQQIPPERRRSETQLARMTLPAYVASRPRRRSAPQNIVLIFDQFEEILTADPLAIEAKHAFFRQLGELLLDPHIWALFAIREDYLPALDPYAQQVPTHLKNWLRLDLLRRDAAHEAISSTAVEGGREFDPAAVDKLVRDLATMKMQQPDGTFRKQTGLYVEPLQLQVVCRGLWERMPEAKQTIELADIERFGDVTDALSGYYADEVARRAESDMHVERTIREWVGNRLITPDGIRSQVLRGAGKSEGLDNGLIASLVDTHLVRGEQRDGATWYELAHDRLIEPVRNNNRDWFDAHLHKVQKDASVWETQGRPTSLLLLGSDLAEAEHWAGQNESSLTTTEREFLGASAAKQHQDALRRRLVVILTVVALLALGAVAVASIAVGKARKEANSASIAKADADAAKRLADASDLNAKQQLATAQAAIKDLELQKGIADNQSLLAQQQAELAAAASADAADRKETADQITYVVNMNLAGAESDKGNDQQVFQLLDAYLPATYPARDQSHRRAFTGTTFGDSTTKTSGLANITAMLVRWSFRQTVNCLLQPARITL